MKNIFLVFILFLFVQEAKSQGIDFFHGTWEEALIKAKETDKLIFVDAFTKWCGPCKRMAKNVFPKQKVGDYYNSRFINVKMDMENADNIEFIRKYPVKAYPTLFFIDGEGEIVLKSKGAKDADGLIKLAKKSHLANNKSADYTIAYEKGKRDFDFMIKYIKELNAGGNPSLKIANSYIKSKPDISEEQMSAFIFEALSEADSRIFELYIAHKSFLIKKYGKLKYNDKILKSCHKTLDKAIAYESIELKDIAIKICKTEHKEAYGLFKLEANKKYYNRTYDLDNYISAVKKYYKSIAKKNADKLFALINEMLTSYTKNKNINTLVENYLKQLIKLEDSVNYLMFAGQYHYKNKNLETSISYMERALVKAKEEKKNIKRIEAILKMYRA